MKKLLSLMVAVTLLVSCTTPCFAGQIVRIYDQNGQPWGEYDPDTEWVYVYMSDDYDSYSITRKEFIELYGYDPADYEQKQEQTVTEKEEEEEPLSGGSENPVIVDVSENSVQAIADAVSDELNGYVLKEFSNGQSYYIPATTSEYPYVFSYIQNHIIFVYHMTEPCKMGHMGGSSDWRPYQGGDVIRYYDQSGNHGATFEYSDPYEMNAEACWGSTLTTSAVYYSNFDIYTTDGDLYFPGTGVQYMVSFDTGFEDYVMDEQPAADFVAPVAEYEGYRFEGWYFDEDYTKPYSPGYEFSSNTTLYAKWTKLHTLSFVTDIEGFEITSVTVPNGQAYELPVFNKPGYNFIGAYTDADMTADFVNGTIITDDTVLYLHYEEIVYDGSALAYEQVQRLEALIYVQMATSTMLCALFIFAVFFRRKSGTGC